MQCLLGSSRYDLSTYAMSLLRRLRIGYERTHLKGVGDLLTCCPKECFEGLYRFNREGFFLSQLKQESGYILIRAKKQLSILIQIDIIYLSRKERILKLESNPQESPLPYPYGTGRLVGGTDGLKPDSLLRGLA